VKLAPAGFNFHSGILKARPDINCVLHVHAGAVIGALEDGLVVYNQSGCALYGEVGYHAFEGLANVNDEVPRILRDLGSKHTLIMTNHGLLSVGGSLAEAFGYMRALIDACTLQERVMATGGKLKPIPVALQEHTKAQMSGGRNGPREDISWAYWRRLAERLDPAFAS
jgi:ribulose-5-phosphate 4-epimerase/fuculose-1-phosphate aldolase